MKIKRNSRNGGVVMQLDKKESRIRDTAPAPAASTLSVFQLKRILVPVDFSDCSAKALQYALPFARQFGATLLVTHVIQPYIPIPEMTGVDVELIEAQMRHAAERELKVVCQSLPADVASEQVLRIGHAQTEIVNAAKELNADLIIVSTHGRSGLAHVFLGSTAERVIRHAGCPVLVVRENEREFVKSPVTTKTPATTGTT
jgi:universal stress protein A